MSYLIDGHNLIPKIPGITLRDLDDENQLIVLLQEFCRRTRKHVEVYFDNAPLGEPIHRKFGSVNAYFIPQGRTADKAIQMRLQKLGKQASNWTVISSDQAVQFSARTAHAKYLSSETFARMLSETSGRSDSDHRKNPDIHLNEEDIDKWLKLFTDKKDKT